MPIYVDGQEYIVMSWEHAEQDHHFWCPHERLRNKHQYLWRKQTRSNSAIYGFSYVILNGENAGTVIEDSGIVEPYQYRDDPILDKLYKAVKRTKLKRHIRILLGWFYVGLSFIPGIPMAAYLCGEYMSKICPYFAICVVLYLYFVVTAAIWWEPQAQDII